MESFFKKPCPRGLNAPEMQSDSLAEKTRRGNVRLARPERLFRGMAGRTSFLTQTLGEKKLFRYDLIPGAACRGLFKKCRKRTKGMND